MTFAVVVTQDKHIISERGSSLSTAISGHIRETMCFRSFTELSPKGRRLDEMPTWIRETRFLAKS